MYENSTSHGHNTIYNNIQRLLRNTKNTTERREDILLMKKKKYEHTNHSSFRLKNERMVDRTRIYNEIKKKNKMKK